MREFLEDDDLELTMADAGSEPCVCRFLRTKTGFGASVGYTSWKTGESSTASYWCLRTMNTIGPDEHVVHAQRCCSGRSCFHSEEE